jgi:hypothetical protein
VAEVATGGDFPTLLTHCCRAGAAPFNDLNAAAGCIGIAPAGFGGLSGFFVYTQSPELPVFSGQLVADVLFRTQLIVRF